MKNYDRIISSIRNGNPLFKMINMGFKPEDIKQSALEILDPYFVNKDMLRQNVLDMLPEVVILERLSNIPFLLDGLKTCLQIYKDAGDISPETCFKSLAWSQQQVTKSLREFWAVFCLEIDKNKLEPDEYLHECLRNIGDVTEGLIKPYLRILWHQLQITKYKGNPPSLADSVELGRLVREVSLIPDLRLLMVPAPWNLGINQWRNIAYHHSAVIQNDEIVCSYGLEPRINEIKLKMEELIQVVQTISDVYQCLKLAHTIFYVDYLPRIAPFSISTLKEREEAGLVNFTMALLSQGFDVVSFEKTERQAKVIVQDLTDSKSDMRWAHASQFLFSLWLFTESTELLLEYRERDGTRRVELSTDSSVCSRIYDNELDEMDLARTIQIVDLKAARQKDY